MKLGLGTVQFGLNYGINNLCGKPQLDQVETIIRCALVNEIRLLDTAADYGDSEERLGKIISEDTRFQIITKLSKEGEARLSIVRSLNRLNRKKIHGVLVHHFEKFTSSPSCWNEMQQAKSEGLVEQIGFSLYLPEQLELLLEKEIDFDIVQIPYNVFDRRFERYFRRLNEKGIKIHTRSVFMQGLVFTDVSQISSFFDPIKPKLRSLRSLSEKNGKSIESLCLNFVNSNPYINNIIIGVDSVQNLERNIRVLQETLSQIETDNLEVLKEDNEQMILPFNWKI